MLDLTDIWKSKRINRGLKVKLVKVLIWLVIAYGTEAWILSSADEKKLISTELWLYRRMLRISWEEKRTNESIYEELEE